MKKRIRKEVSIPGHSVFRWFLISFLATSVIFCLSLFPLIMYCQNVFTELELKKSSQQLDSGIVQLENTITSILSSSQTLSRDPRFVPLRYTAPDYTSIEVSVRNQMKDYLNGLVFPLPLVKDCALQFTGDIAVTTNNTFFNDYFSYYPNFFQVDQLDNEAWLALLEENGSGFLPVHHIYSKIGDTTREYDALIYSVPWTKSSYIYACLDVTDIKSVLIAESDLSTCYLTLSDSKGTWLYSDCPNTASQYHTITKKSSARNLSVTIHIPETVFTAKMKPLYLFLGVYCSICILVLMITIIISSRISTRPLLKIITMLENSNRLQNNNKIEEIPKNPSHSIKYGFHYIQNRFEQAENRLEQYHNTIHTQHKVLQARFLEKALNNQLSTAKDKEMFHTYFPDFPENFCLVQLRLLEQPDGNSSIYSDALYILQSFLQNVLPNTYQQQMNDMELLLIIANAEYKNYVQTLDFLINNINHEEPSYRICGIASNFYQSIQNLPTAYRELQDLDGLSFPENMSQVCTFTDYPYAADNAFHMADILTLYTAISYGNREMALQKLCSCSEKLKEGNRNIYELIRSILLCIKMEHPNQLMNINIPAYTSSKNLYSTLEKTIQTFCDIIQEEKHTATDPFVQELVHYIDEHFNDYGLCLSALEEAFNCSSSKIQKAFKNNLQITVSDYIEKKRMELANELLFQKERSITEIALECGFSNSNSFYKAYQRFYGINPSAVRESAKKAKK